MVNEHLDVESHWLRHLLFVSDGNTTDIEGKESDRHGVKCGENEKGGTGGQKGQLRMDR